MLKPNLPLMPHPFKALMKAADSGPNKSAERAGQSVADTSANDMKEEVGLMFSERAESQKRPSSAVSSSMGCAIGSRRAKCSCTSSTPCSTPAIRRGAKRI